MYVCVYVYSKSLEQSIPQTYKRVNHAHSYETPKTRVPKHTPNHPHHHPIHRLTAWCPDHVLAIHRRRRDKHGNPSRLALCASLLLLLVLLLWPPSEINKQINAGLPVGSEREEERTKQTGEENKRQRSEEKNKKMTLA